MNTPTELPIDMLKPLAERYNLAHVILFAHSEIEGRDHIVTFGVTIAQSAQAAEFGNRLKGILGWPASLHQQPQRVIDLQNRVKELEEELEKYR